MTTSLQVLCCRLLSVLVILVLPAGRVSQELHPSGPPPVPPNPTMALSPDAPGWREFSGTGGVHSASLPTSHARADAHSGPLVPQSGSHPPPVRAGHSPLLQNFGGGALGSQAGTVQLLPKEEDFTDSGRSYYASELRPSSSSPSLASAISSSSSTAFKQEAELRGPAYPTLELIRPHPITLREAGAFPSDGGTATPFSPISTPTFATTGSDITARDTTDVSPDSSSADGAAGSSLAPVPSPGSTVSRSRGEEPPGGVASVTTEPPASPTDNLQNRLFPAANQTDWAPVVCLSRVDIVWMVLAITVPVATCSVLLTVCCMRKRKRKKASGQESSLSYWNDAITMDYFSRHAVELPREIQPLETAEEHETFLSPNGDYVDNGMVLVNPFCQETLFISREKAYKS